MASLKEIKQRIRAVQSTQKVTSAMKMIAIAQLRLIQPKVMNGRVFLENLQSLFRLTVLEWGTAHPFLRPRGSEKLLVLLTSDQGMCGHFNSSLIRRAQQHLKEDSWALMVFGQKGIRVFNRTHDLVRQPEINWNDWLFQQMISRFQEVWFLSYSFLSPTRTSLSWERILPLPLEPQDFEGWIEPNEESFLNPLVQDLLSVHINQKFCENRAAELSYRMNAMESAVQNATDIARNLKQVYNRSRQALITQELMEIISGANAIEQAETTV
jgi:F-type H+-transporting ATPase subunit gamma